MSLICRASGPGLTLGNGDTRSPARWMSRKRSQALGATEPLTATTPRTPQISIWRSAFVVLSLIAQCVFAWVRSNPLASVLVVEGVRVPDRHPVVGVDDGDRPTDRPVQSHRDGESRIVTPARGDDGVAVERGIHPRHGQQRMQAPYPGITVVRAL